MLILSLKTLALNLVSQHLLHTSECTALTMDVSTCQQIVKPIVHSINHSLDYKQVHKLSIWDTENENYI